MTNYIDDFPAKPEPHQIVSFIRNGKISLYQLSLRLNKSYSHTRNLVTGYSDLTEETRKIFDDILKSLGDGK